MNQKKKRSVPLSLWIYSNLIWIVLLLSIFISSTKETEIRNDPSIAGLNSKSNVSKELNPVGNRIDSVDEEESITRHPIGVSIRDALSLKDPIDRFLFAPHT